MLDPLDIRGQVVYKKLINGAIQHKELIDKQLTKGIYLLRINDGKQTDVRKVVVR